MAQFSRLDRGRDDLREPRCVVEYAAGESVTACQCETAIQCLERRLLVARMPFAFGQRGFQCNLSIDEARRSGAVAQHGQDGACLVRTLAMQEQQRVCKPEAFPLLIVGTHLLPTAGFGATLEAELDRDRQRASRVVLQQMQANLLAAHLREKSLMTAALQHAVHVVEQLEGFAE